MLRRIVPIILVAAVLFATGAGLLLWITPTQAAPAATKVTVNTPQRTLTDTDSITKGAYIVQLALGCGCHFNPTLGGLAGGEDFSDPSYGTLFSRNITPHPETGIGNYTPTELETVIRTGKRLNGEQLFPAMPYMKFSGMAEEDMDNLIAFLLEGQAPISNTITPRALFFDPPPFTPTVTVSATAPVSGVARGEYIVNVLGACSDCHGDNLAGSPGFAPNITSDPVYGIGQLTTAELSNTLHTGNRPTISDSLRFDGSPVGSVMGQIIQGAIKIWTPEDVTAVAEYLLTVPPVGNQPPLFAPTPDISITVGSSFVYTTEVSDFDVFDTLTVTAPYTLPTWLTLGPTQSTPRPVNGAAVLTGTATISDVGVSPVVLVVADSAGAMTTSTFTITVSSLSPVSPTLALPLISNEDVITP